MYRQTSFLRNPNYDAIISTPLGKLGIVTSERHLTQLELLTDDLSLQHSTDPLISQISYELNAYFINPCFKFTIPCQMQGTAFQKNVWEALSQVPVGKTITYGALAKKLKTGARAVGNACRANPLLIIIPCHRVLGQHGLGGFNGDHTGDKIAIKQWLLNHES